MGAWYTLFVNMPSSLGNLHTTKIVVNFCLPAERPENNWLHSCSIPVAATYIQTDQSN